MVVVHKLLDESLSKYFVVEKNLVKFLELQNLNIYIIVAQNREETKLPDVKVTFILFDLQYNESATLGRIFVHV